MNKETIIKANKVCCQSGKHYLLQNIDWEVKRGDHWIVFGLNGSGKTTLLSAIAGFKQITGGRLEVFGEEYNSSNLCSIARRIGFVSTSFFDRYYTSEGVLSIVLSGLSGTLGVDSHICDADVLKAKQLLAQWDVSHKVDMPFSMLSKGEQQNVLIARALIAEPEVLVLDEPGAGLDVFARKHMMEWVRTQAETTDSTIIYVTHYPEEIQDCFDRCLVLQKGSVLANGELSELRKEEKYGIH